MANAPPPSYTALNWEGTMPNEFNVRDFGAYGDGELIAPHDDANAFSATIFACMAAGGGVVYVPPGVYNINGTIPLTTARDAFDEQP